MLGFRNPCYSNFPKNVLFDAFRNSLFSVGLADSTRLRSPGGTALIHKKEIGWPLVTSSCHPKN